MKIDELMTKSHKMRELLGKQTLSNRDKEQLYTFCIQVNEVAVKFIHLISSIKQKEELEKDIREQADL